MYGWDKAIINAYSWTAIFALNQMTKLVFTFDNNKKNPDYKESYCIYPNSLYHNDEKYFFSLKKIIFED